MRAHELSWPKVLRNEREIAAYIEQYSSSFCDVERIEDEFIGAKAVLTKVATDSLSFGHADANIENRKRQQKFNRMDASKQPPIVVADNTVVDGNHRLRAAKMQNLPSIWVYNVIDA